MSDLRLFLLIWSKGNENKHVIVRAPDAKRAKLIAFAKTNDMDWLNERLEPTELKIPESMEVLKAW